MPFDPEWFNQIPPAPAPEDVDDAVTRTRLASAQNFLTANESSHSYSAFAWAVLLAQEDEQLARVHGSYAFVASVDFGFVDPEIDLRDPGPAVIVNINPPTDLSDTELHDLLAVQVEPVRIRDVQFPVVPRIGFVELQSPPALAAPSISRVAVWIDIHRSTNLQSGWLVCHHSIYQHSLGKASVPVRYSDGSTGRIIDRLGYCMDAAVASSNTGTPAGVGAVRALDVLPIGLTLEFSDRSNIIQTASLLSVDTDIGLTRYAKAPIRLTYDWSTSTPGDSGSLLTDKASGRPVAMHQGARKRRDRKGSVILDHYGNARRDGFGLCLWQVEIQTDGELFL
jgi:hypothetical protein